MSAWRHKDEWSMRGNAFCVTVTRHAVSVSEPDSDGPNRWAVYAYIYPKHPHFEKFSGPNMWQEATDELPLHRGASLLEYPMYEGKVTCAKVGADYHHLYDERFTHYATKDDALEVFGDAKRLFDRLEAMTRIES